MLEPRFAIYLAPPPDSPLWRFGSYVLGYDAASGLDRPGFAPTGFERSTWRGMTARPRAYGFHATLKAPFRLAPQTTEAELQNELEKFSQLQQRFDLGPLAVKAVGSANGRGFAALLQTRPSPALASLEHDTVRAFDHFRAPMTEEERNKRNPGALTTRQCAALDRFGYPHIGPDYRFHMTLCAELDDIATIADSLAVEMASAIGTAHFEVDALVLFRQDQPDQNFRILKRFAMAHATLASGTSQGS
jgi:2'-5' RNA ligase